MGLDRHMLNVGDAVFVFYDSRTFFPGAFDITFADFEEVGNIRPCLRENKTGHLIFTQVGMQQGCFRAGSIFGVHHRFQDFVFNINQLKGIYSDFFACGSDTGDWVANIASAITAKDVAVLEIEADESGEIIAGNNSFHTRQGCRLTHID